MNIPVKFYNQTRFGGTQSDPGERGNCDKTCLATLIGCDPSEIPDYQELTGEAWWKERDRFLHGMGFKIVTFNGLVGTAGGICIAVGRSPRGAWSHSVIAKVTETEGGHMVELLHDPHPSREFISGTPTEFDFVFRLVQYDEMRQEEMKAAA